MVRISFTDEQLRAIRATGRSVIVSAAAGSGKTAVLAERCAYLVCDAPPSARCHVNELLVLTFTEAAVSEMRSRIVQAIRERAAFRPTDERLREQLVLIDAAQISTIHAFCLWLVRRWFSDAGIDPAVTVLDAEEARLLRVEVLDSVFQQLYEVVRVPGELFERVDAMTSPQSASDVNQKSATQTPEVSNEAARSPIARREDTARAFVHLVQDYGLGDDGQIARFVLRLYDFTRSLPDPDGWLRQAVESLSQNRPGLLRTWIQELRTELAWQCEHCENLLGACPEIPATHGYIIRMQEYLDRLHSWSARLADDDRTVVSIAGAASSTGEEQEVLTAFETVRREIHDFRFARVQGVAIKNDAGAAAVRDAIKGQYDDVKKRLFAERLKTRFGLFSVEECIEGLQKTAPYVATLVELVGLFRDAYAERKRALNVVDFADLERFAFELLCVKGDPGRPSDVARVLHQRFAYVLVDEFQDINPIQRAILQLASRESDPHRPNNLFGVGDIKQSIYRFRLAEPSLFAERLARFRAADDEGLTLSLQTNFRSRREILDAVNLVFRSLMGEGCGPVVYDDESELRPGRQDAAKAPSVPVEVHLLEKHMLVRAEDADAPDVGEEDDDLPEPSDETLERGVPDASHPGTWSSIEREAYLIGMCIRDGRQSDQLRIDGQRFRYRDAAILLRAARINAELMASMLSRLGIPTYAEAGGSLFAAREVRDVLAVLAVLDNVQQDIPLAAVLRSGILGERFCEDDLVRIRCLDRSVPFHAVVRRYAAHGPDDDVRWRLQSLFTRIERFRQFARRRPIAELLWKIYDEQGFLAYAGGLPNGPQRRANLGKLHELARQFGAFRRQGLHRFLRFVKSLQDEDAGLAAAPTIGEADDVVRIMTIHQAKGLEFPVVFVAGLGTAFNLGDRKGRLLFERRSGVGLRIVDTEQMLEYPSVAHRLVAGEVERTTREEEMRILYVAMTRAREKLVLVGSMRRVTGLRDRLSSSLPPTTPARLGVSTAKTPLDWLLPVLSAAPTGVVRGLREVAGGSPLLDVHLHSTEEMSKWTAEKPSDETEEVVRRVASRLKVLPAAEPTAPDDAGVEEVLRRIDHVYPHLASASAPAAVGVSEFKEAFDFTQDKGEKRRPSTEDPFHVPLSKYAVVRGDDPTRRGILMHRVLQLLDFAAARDVCGVASELQRMIDGGWIEKEDRPLIDENSLAWFVGTPLAEAIRRAGRMYRREFAYTASEPLADAVRSVSVDPQDFVLVRGIVDGVLPTTHGIDVIDFKTDSVEIGDLAEHALRYRSQMELYAQVMSRIFRRPVGTGWLVFLSPREIVSWRDLAEP